MKIPNGKSPYDVKRRLIIPKLNKYRYLWTRCSLHVYPNFHWYLASVIKLLKTALTSLFQNENKGFQNGLQHGIDKIISGPDNNTLGPFKKKIPKPLINKTLHTCLILQHVLQACYTIIKQNIPLIFLLFLKLRIVLRAAY